VKLDLEGRLLAFEAAPPLREEVIEGVGGEPEWNVLLEAAGLDPAELAPQPPVWVPPVHADIRRAWSGVYPDSRGTDIWIEAAAFGGLPVSFRVLEPWSRFGEIAPAAALGPTPLALFFVSAMVLAGWVSWRNVRLGRGDLSTAMRLAVFVAITRIVWLLGAHHVKGTAELSLLVSHLAWAAERVLIITIFYLAVEPYLRRLWPTMLTSWVRLFSGRVRDPMVGRDLLLGALFGVALALMSWPRLWWLPEVLGVEPEAPYFLWISLEALRGGTHLVAAAAAIIGSVVMQVTLPAVVTLVVFRLLLRKTWLALAATSLVVAVLLMPTGGSLVPFLVTLPFVVLVMFGVLFRFGLLTWSVMMVVSMLLGEMPATPHPSDWYFTSGVLVVTSLVGMGLYGARVALAGRPMFRDELLTETPTGGS
jgi:hypothetical protein